MVKGARPNPLRYFLVVRLHPTYALVVLGVIVVVGGVMTMMEPREMDAGLGMVLLAQMFLASTGFVMRARQGHFDPLLARGSGRTRVAAAHWAMSILPGVLAWMTLAVIGGLLQAPDAISAVVGSRAAALVIVSALSWTAGFWLPRGAAGMLWIALLMGLVLRRAELLAVPGGPGPLLLPVVHTATIIACPFLLLGKYPPLAPGTLPAAIALPLLLLWASWRWSRGLDVYLVDRS